MRKFRLTAIPAPKHEMLNRKRGGKRLQEIVLLVMSCLPCASAENFELPVSPNPVGANSDLASPNLHPGVDVGYATGQYNNDNHTLTITQTTPSVILDWNSFNIAAGNTVQFKQPSSTSVALNDIHQQDASQIFGVLKANGQVYLVNNNGFVFGSHASVNLNSLIATTLNITDAVFQQGITNVVNSTAPTTNTAGNTTTSAVAALTGDGSVYLKNGEKIQILVEKDAVINAADTGRILLAAPQVENDGTITAPDGQVILVAATDKVYLQESSTSDLRGLLVEVKTGGDVKNLGTILTDRGNTTMMGFAVTQQGIISASSSVAVNGSVRLLAREGAQLVSNSNNSTANYLLEPLSTTRSSNLGDGLGTQAKVTLAPGSSTSVTLDDSGGTASSGQVQPQSLVDVEAGYIDMQNGAKIVAPGGQVDLIASATPTNSNAVFPAAAMPSTVTSTSNNSRVLLETGSLIDVSGIQNVTLPMSSNIINLTLYSYELRNDAIQKNGLLYGQNVYVDTRLGTSLADVSEAEASRQYSVEYRNSNAGTVNLYSEGDVIVQKGANINISGGSLDYLGGVIPVTELIGQGGLYTMADANPNLVYQQIFNSNYYQSGYHQGMNAGTVNISSRDLLLDGNIQASTVAGQFQRSAASLATGGQLNIDTTWTGIQQQDVIIQNSQTYTPTPTGAVQSPLYLSNALFNDGLSGLTLKTGGNLNLSQNTVLQLPNFADLSLQAGSIDIEGQIIAPNGAVKLATNGYINAAEALSGQILLGANADINTSGLWVNDVLTNLQGNTPGNALAINGGNISIQAQGNLLLSAGASLMANGGAWLQDSAKLTGGKAGNISLSTVGNNQNTQLQLNADLSAYGLSSGGSLSISANNINVADSFTNQVNSPYTLDLTASRLETGGFSNYNLTANAGNLSIAANTTLNLQQTNWLLDSNAINSPSSNHFSNLTYTELLPENQRTPVDLTLTLNQNGTIGGYVNDRSISIGQNAVINADPAATLTLNSDANIAVAGALNAPGGTINLSITDSQPGYNPNQAIVLAQNAQLNVAGTTVLTPNNDNLLLGDVLAGGAVNLTANRGYILMDTSSSINVSGSNATLDIVNTSGDSRQNIASNAGSINLTAAEGMVLQGSFQAQAGSGQTAAGAGSAAAGGSLSIIMNAQNTQQQDDYTFPTNSRNIDISQLPVSVLSSAQIAGGVIPTTINGLAYISSQQISQAGFDSLKLATLAIPQPTPLEEPQEGAIIFNGDVSLALKLNLVLDTPWIGHTWNTANDTGQVTLSSDMFTLGSSLNQTPLDSLNNPTTAYNNGTAADLTVTANQITLQGASLINGFADTRLNSSNDINLIGVTNPNPGISLAQSLIGSLSLTGELDLSAREIYPSTLSQFSISIDSSLSPNGVINILPATAAAETPLSAAGQLTISAPTINSSGNLLAPFGNITLSATNSLNLLPGSLTSVSDSSQTFIPFGQTQGSGEYWTYNILTDQNIITGTPQKAITLSAPNINLQTDSVVNLNGGGDLLAYELVQAPGGSIDYLNPSYQQSYAVLPTLNSGFAPYDYLEFPGSGVSLGETVYLSANASGLAAGNYVLLPSYYALLPGAFLVTPIAGSDNMAAYTTTNLSDGATVVSGYLHTMDSNVSSSLWSGFEIQPGRVATEYSPYQLSYASQYFAANTSAGSIASLPADAGNLSLQTQLSLNLAGEIYATAAGGGLGGQLDISGDNFLISNQTGTAPSGTLTLNANALNKLGVDSILIGGSRSRSSSGTRLTVSAQTVDVAAYVDLHAPEIILAATGSINVANGTEISATGSLNRTDSVLTIANASETNTDGALLRVSSAGAATVLRTGADSNNGDLTLAAGSELSSSGSILLDADQTGSLLGNIAMTQGQLTLSGNLITLGGAANPNTGFQLSESTLNQLHVDNLILDSAGAINIAGAINLQLNNLTLDSAGIVGNLAAGQTALINANSITLQNTGSNSASAAPAISGQGQLQLQANTVLTPGTANNTSAGENGSLTLGTGNYSLSGFSQINLSAASRLTDNGNSNISVAGNLNIATPIWNAAAGADSSLNLPNGNLTLQSNGPATVSSGLGAMLAINANQITDQGLIAMPSGTINLTAAQPLSLANGGTLDVSGRSASLGSNLVNTAGGKIYLNSQSNAINLAQGSLINVSGASLGGNAGSLSLSAAGDVSLNGELSGTAVAGSNGGNFSLTTHQFSTGTDSSFSALNHLLSNSGFNSNLSVHQTGTGDLLVAATDTVNATGITLTADNGSIYVQGNLNVNGSQAGNIQLSANDGVQIEKGAVLTAISNLASTQGGDIVLTSAPVVNQGSGVTIAAGANLDVAGGTGGSGGSLQIIVNQLGSNDAAVNIADNTVQGAATMVVDAVSHNTVTTLSNPQIQQWNSQNQNFLAAANLNSDLQTRLGGFTLQPGLDIINTSGLTLDLAESVAGTGWQQASSLDTWFINLSDVAGGVGTLTENGVALKAVDNSNLTANGTYYFDNNPQSATFRDLFVRLNPVRFNYNPNTLSQNSSFSLVEDNGWDLALPYTQTANISTGLLSLRSSSDINIEQTLSDGFTIASDTTLQLQSGTSWGYNIVAGADLASANLQDVQTGNSTGNLSIGDNTSIRTGTGNIFLAASGNITLTDSTSTVYTAGKSTISDPYAADRPLFSVAFPQDGGNVSLQAGGNIIGATTSQLMSDWLQRSGIWNAGNPISSSNQPVAWGIDFGSLIPTTIPGSSSSIVNTSLGFRENIGALGGGNVSISAGGNIQDLSVMLPTSAITNIVNDVAVLQEQGGGNLTVAANGNIAGGVYYVEKGVADISSQSAITGGSEYTSGPIFAMGASQFNVTAGNGISVGTVMNPFVLAEAKFFYASQADYFTTYTPDSGINLMALANDVILNNDTSVIAQNYTDYSYVNNKLTLLGNILSNPALKASLNLLNLYPGNLNVNALNGGVQLKNNLNLYPAAGSSFNLLASGDITFASNVILNQLDVSPALFLSDTQPMASPAAASAYLYTILASGADISKLHAATPIHAADTAPNQIVSAQGSIIGLNNSSNGGGEVNAAKATDVSAAMNLNNISLLIQNLSGQYQDVSTISVGGDIIFPTIRNTVTGTFQGSGAIVIAGPGLLNVWAGGTIDLGISAGITSVGALNNPALPGNGAEITVLAGDQINQQALSNYLQNYVNDLSYQTMLSEQLSALYQQPVSTNNSNLATSIENLLTAIGGARNQISPNNVSSNLDLALPILFAQFNLAATSEAISNNTADYQIGFQAIQTLFPTPATGNIILDFSQIQTLAGGNINLLAPGGMLNVGLASTDLSSNKSAAELGVVAQGLGNINILTQGDVQVNQSRVFTLDGGNITAWSSAGNIDAGRGAKSSLGNQLPIGSFDAYGNLILEYPPSISGSGIRAQSGYNSPIIGNVTLVAPNGVINADEAGIGGHDLTIAATAIIGVSNFQATGNTLGIPQTQTISVATDTAGNAAAAVNKNPGMTPFDEEMALNRQQQNKPVSIAILSTQLVGFGVCSVSDVREGRKGCGN